ncbi:hypothetical protein Aple_041470 [Acrocarpospora pleiomorpha]|uniref:Terpene synthase n=1 Tax=Acrocarpospora pleiomorpha TaxID=90975 RepID=A0A5M3XNL8_9ACTN|nr:terpene synthase family protein [Acrocarpospora pleiomorpha]GES21251.1 hypothetical protein Aple_041470 [Acrocarpospora pleiomorpha]
MSRLSVEDGELLSASEHGRVSALAAQCLRDLYKCSERYPELFPEGPFAPTVFTGVALANAWGSPWATADQLRIAVRTSLWVFAADWLVDYVAKSADEVDAIVRGCLEVADGARPESHAPLMCFLADIRDELVARPAFAALGNAWRAQLERYLAAMAREWEWKAALASGSPLPTFEDYLANADNFGSALVNISHWIYGGDPATVRHVAELSVVSREVQRILRLLNDLATYERDLGWGDLNAQMLGVGKADISRRLATLVAYCRDLLHPLRDSCPQEAIYLERQIGFSTGFYGMTDYWGAL